MSTNTHGQAALLLQFEQDTGQGWAATLVLEWPIIQSCGARTTPTCVAHTEWHPISSPRLDLCAQHYQHTPLDRANIGMYSNIFFLSLPPITPIAAICKWYGSIIYIDCHEICMQAKAYKSHIPACHLRARDCHKTLISWIENPGRFKETSWNMKIMWVELEGTSVARTPVGLATPASTHFQRDNDCFRSLNGKQLETTHTTYTRSAKDNYRLIVILYTMGHMHIGTG